MDCFWVRPVIFTCPRTGFSVQSLIAESVIVKNTIHIPVDCPICERQHILNLADIKNLGEITE
jgi:hypothetical protein